MKSRKYLYTIIAILFAVAFYIYDNYSFEKETVTSKEIDSNFNFLPLSTTGQIVHHNSYSLSYNEKCEQAEWVAYELNASHISNSNLKRPLFELDKKVKTKSAHYKNYSNSGYNKGHLIPAADRKYSEDAFKETFLMSNVSPQKPDFNSGIWNNLEQKTRYWAQKYKQLYVITGGILDPGLKTIGTEKVAVPNYFYKIILDYHQPEIKAIAFLIPHKNSNKALYQFVTSIDQIEVLTGIDFFPELPDDLENELEKSSSYANWSFR